MGFASSWIQLVMSCVTTVQLAMLLGGHPSWSFKPSWGLRQGDPISPYLFLFVSEVLSLMIQKACLTGVLQGIRLSHTAPTISHLMFADDTLIFLKASVQNNRNLVHLLNAYCNASGQWVNFSKSTLYFSFNTLGNICDEIWGVFSMPEVDGPWKYLGLSTIWGRAKREALLYIKGRILLKIQGWKQQLLCQAGREVLLKATTQAVPQ